MNKFIDIGDYNLGYGNKKVNILYKWIVVLIFIITITLILIFNKYHYMYYQGSGILKERDYLTINVYIEDIDKVIKNKYIMIGGSTLTYNVANISEEFTAQGTILYKEITLKIDLEDTINIENNYIKFRIMIDKISMLDYVLSKIKGE